MNPILVARSLASWSCVNRVISIPSTKIWPEFGLSNAPNIETSVVFPEPEGPMITTNSPASMARETSLTARTALRPSPKVFTRFAQLRTGSAMGSRLQSRNAAAGSSFVNCRTGIMEEITATRIAAVPKRKSASRVTCRLIWGANVAARGSAK